MSILTNDLTHLRPEQKRALLEKLLRERQNQIPLSSAQKRLWFLEKLHPDSAVYNVPTALRLRGPVNVEALRQSLETIVARHHALRTTFAEADGTPIQKVNEITPFDLPVTDLGGLDMEAREVEAQKHVARAVKRPFDLAGDLMLRAELLKLAPDEHLLVLVTHHIASDEWSLRVLLAELSDLYAAKLEYRAPSLPSLGLQYSDFARRQQAWLEGEECRRQLAYWAQALKGVETLQLPAGKRGTAEQTFNGSMVAAKYPVALLEGLKELSQAHQTTLFMTLLTAFNVVLHRYSQQEDIVVGCPIAGRNSVDTEGLIGFFVNTLPIRTRVEGNQTFRGLLASIREQTLAAYACQDVPFDRIVEEIQPERTPGRMPLVQAVFALNNDYVQEHGIPGVVAEEIEVGTGTSKFDLTFVTRQTKEGLSAIVEYNSDIFDERFIERFLGHYGEVLRGIVQNPGEIIARIPLLTSGERDYLLKRLNATSRPYPRSACVHELFEAQVVRTPDAIAASFRNETITYLELNARANQLAHSLLQEKAGGNSLVGVYMERSVEMIVAFLGILKAGAAYVPLDLSYPKERLAFMIADSKMALILTKKSLLAELPVSPVPAIPIDERWESISQKPRQGPLNCSTPESLAYIIYTSGSMGVPKGVPVPHRGITRLVCNTDYVTITPEDCIAQASNASFDAATFEIWGALLNGARIVGIDKDTTLVPNHFAASLREGGVTILFLTTALFNQMAREIPDAFAEMKTVLFGGEAVDPKSVETVLACEPPERLLHVYGPTENTTFSTWHLIRDVTDEASTVPIGQPIANSEVYILDPQLQPVPIGINGEIYVGGDGLAHGYWQRPELTAARFIPHPFSNVPGARLYKTGDLARFNEDGDIEFDRRVDHQVKLRGFRIELGEIESLLTRHPAVSNCVVLLREDSPGDKRLVAYIIPSGKNLSTADLRSHLRARLPDYMIPAVFVMLESFPLTPNEKIDRKALPAPDTKHSEIERAFVPPRTETERKLATIWEKVLGVAPVGITENFFELGGHSLLAVKVFTAIEKELGQKLPLATLFRAPTVEQIATVLGDSGQEEAWSTIVDIQPNGTKPPFFWIHTLGGDGGGGFFYYRKLAELVGPDQPSFGIRSPQKPFTKIEEMAKHYVQEIKNFQPEGPYFLGGFCFGGNVAYEMAQTLLAGGDELGLLVMLESSPPNVDQRQSWTATAAKYSLENLVENVKEFVAISPQEQLSMLKNKSKRLKQKIRTKIGSAEDQGRKPAELKDMIDLANYPEGYVMYAETHWHALTEYHPQPYPGELVLFRARKQGLSNFNHALGWDALVGDRVEVNVIPGTHESMLQEPNVQIVATKLRTLLDRAQKPPAARGEPVLAAV